MKLLPECPTDQNNNAARHEIRTWIDREHTHKSRKISIKNIRRKIYRQGFHIYALFINCRKKS